jgi:hypothetical protein
MSVLNDRKSLLGEETIQHDVSLMDPKEIFGPDGPLGKFSGVRLLHGMPVLSFCCRM